MHKASITRPVLNPLPPLEDKVVPSTCSLYFVLHVYTHLVLSQSEIYPLVILIKSHQDLDHHLDITGPSKQILQSVLYKLQVYPKEDQFSIF